MQQDCEELFSGLAAEGENVCVSAGEAADQGFLFIPAEFGAIFKHGFDGPLPGTLTSFLFQLMTDSGLGVAAQTLCCKNSCTGGRFFGTCLERKNEQEEYCRSKNPW